MSASDCCLMVVLSCLIVHGVPPEVTETCNIPPIEQNDMQRTNSAMNISISPIVFNYQPSPQAPVQTYYNKVTDQFYIVDDNCSLVLYLLSDTYRGLTVDVLYPVTCSYLTDSTLPIPVAQVLKMGQPDPTDDLPMIIPRTWKEGTNIIAKLTFPIVTKDLDNTLQCSSDIGIGTLELSIDVRAIGCPRGKFGPSCLQNCTCLNQARCHTFLGSCSCLSGFSGNRCETWNPIADIKPTELTVVEGGCATFQCEFYPKPWGSIQNTTWLFEGYSLGNGTTAVFDDRSLHLTQLIEAQSGDYTCLGVDEEGFIYKAVARLVVQGKRAQEAATDSTFVTLFAVSAVLLCILLGAFLVSIVKLCRWGKKTNELQMDEQGKSSLQQENDCREMGLEDDHCLSDQEVRFNLVFPEWKLSKDQISKGGQVGSGEFCDVFTAELRWPGLRINVAVKIPTDSDDTNSTRDLTFEFLTLSDVCPHPNIVQLLGLYVQNSDIGAERRCLVLEYMAGGNLLSWLHTQRQNLPLLQSDRLGNIIVDILAGMLQLSKNKVIHRDLSARNILLTADLTAKISDFGLARETYTTGAYRLNLHSEQRLPWLWMAPETLSDGEYSQKSDMWSFGVLLWEAVTLGAVPYPGVSTVDLQEFLQSGNRMLKPKNPLMCSEAWFDIMEKCWDEEPCRRPEIPEISECFVKWQQDLTNFAEISEDANLEQIHVAIDDAIPASLESEQTDDKHTADRREATHQTIATESAISNSHRISNHRDSYLIAKSTPDPPTVIEQANTMDNRVDYLTASSPDSPKDDVKTKLKKEQNDC